MDEVRQHLMNEPGLTFALQHTPGNPDGEWYAAFRDEHAHELTPERGFGYGPTPEAATLAAVEEFRLAEAVAGS